MKILAQYWRLFLYALTAFSFVLLNYVPNKLGSILGCPVILPDTKVPFLSEDFANLSACLLQPGANGLALHTRYYALGADLIFPLLFAATLIVLTMKMAVRLAKFAQFASWTKYALIGFMPVAYLISDFFENYLVVKVLSLTEIAPQTNLITAVTTLKFYCIGLALIILIFFVLAQLKPLSRLQS